MLPGMNNPTYPLCCVKRLGLTAGPPPRPPAPTSLPHCALSKVCSVCSSGYGSGAANQCHECTDDFKGVIFFVLSVAVLVALVVLALLGVFLVSCRGSDCRDASL